jgi:hypothetical protein
MINIDDAVASGWRIISNQLVKLKRGSVYPFTERQLGGCGCKQITPVESVGESIRPQVDGLYFAAIGAVYNRGKHAIVRTYKQMLFVSEHDGTPVSPNPWVNYSQDQCVRWQIVA